MNIQLRKRHKRIWLGLFIPFALILVLGMNAIPKNSIEDIPINYCPLGITNCLATHDDEKALFEFHYENQDSVAKVVVAFENPLKSAFTLVYLSEEENPTDQSILLGEINEMDIYPFFIPWSRIPGKGYLVIYDQLKKRVLHSEPLNSIRP